MSCDANTKFGTSLPGNDGNLNIRFARESDLEQVERIMQTLRDEARAASAPIGALWKTDQVASFLYSMGAAADAAPEPSSLAVRDGLILEDASGSINAFIFYERRLDAWEINYLATSHQARRGGRMSRLIRYLLGLCPPGTPLWLEVHEANGPARQLYQNLGFAEVGRRPRYYPGGGSAILYNYG